MKVVLRPYQKQLIDEINIKFENHYSVLAQLPSGAGKTVVFVEIARQWYERDCKVLVVVNSEETLNQAIKQFRKIINDKIDIGYIKAGRMQNLTAPIQIATVQTMWRRLEDIDIKFDLIIVDEAHHSTTQTYRSIINTYRNSHLLGLTATPVRHDGLSLANIYSQHVYGVQVKDLIDDGYLAKCKIFAMPQISVEGVKIIKEDYDVASMVISKELIQDLIDSYKLFANDKKCMIFATSIKESLKIVKAFNQAGIKSAHLDGDSDSDVRANVIEDLQRNKIKMVSNVMIFNEGIDLPNLDVVMIARPTRSMGMWMQIIGRVTRLYEGKEYGIIIDHTDNHQRLGTPYDTRIWSIGKVEVMTVAESKNCVITVTKNHDRTYNTINVDGFEELDISLKSAPQPEEFKKKVDVATKQSVSDFYKAFMKKVAIPKYNDFSQQ